MRVDSRAHLAASLVTLATGSRNQELSPAKPPSPRRSASSSLTSRVRSVVCVGLGADCREVKNMAPVMEITPKRCHQFSYSKVRITSL
jgi:hypothetical protein